MIRVMVETMKGSDGERHLVFRGLDRFLGWCSSKDLIEANACDALDRDEKPEARQGARSRPIARRTARRVERRRRRTTTRPRPIHAARAAAPRRSRGPALERSRPAARTHPDLSRPHEKPRSPRTAIVGARDGDARGERSATGELVFPKPTASPTLLGAPSSPALRSASATADTNQGRAVSFSRRARAFVSHLAERGFDVDLLDQCLGHSRKGVFGVYQRASRMAERGRALETWAGLVTGAGEAESGRVLAFRAKTLTVPDFHSPVHLAAEATASQMLFEFLISCGQANLRASGVLISPFPSPVSFEVMTGDDR